MRSKQEQFEPANELSPNEIILQWDFSVQVVLAIDILEFGTIKYQNKLWCGLQTDPIIGSSGFLFINQYGNLVLYGKEAERLYGKASIIQRTSADDPGIGDFSVRINPNGSPQIFVYNGTKPIDRSPPRPWRSQMGLYKSTFVNDPDEIYLVHTVPDDSYLLRIIMDHPGHV
ncbi:uncharacterized protein [Populus alba]|uniref:uncharacterized protein n=1 Tax=Populus alba TaxID=43335 RepID=UPI00158AB35B|nr:uncharacterized protein LOC118045598 [Populus alba]